MRITETSIPGAFIVEPEPIADERGFFARTWCAKEFEEKGLCSRFVQNSISFNAKRGTLRGMHFQKAPYEEIKLVSCTTGAIYDVILDVRDSSPAFGKWEAVELTSSNRKMLYIPAGVAHGFQTLENETMVFYQISEFYHPEAAQTIYWNDEGVSISWPLKPIVISKKDKECYQK
ncbi:dTDP-4-dehydrorhamnose 3,5-epimerase [Anaeromusa acidaminophila]|uniref:dTDP-4-dehydrorhamnose 3,5-epimerase n=1 Tax=Anaeromusa acidaminophila TaxID=81464 RepID=UPI000366AA63|nr:dTDP-4-dehydrorhamnose 3,5-epimerase [Anaeromusa acidaminophila]